MAATGANWLRQEGSVESTCGDHGSRSFVHFKRHSATSGASPPSWPLSTAGVKVFTNVSLPPHHHILNNVAPHLASFHHIWLWPHPIPHPTTMFHITFHITDQYTTTFYIPPLTTSRITSPPLPCIASCHSPHSTSFHIAQRSTFRATAHTPIHITPQLSITPF